MAQSMVGDGESSDLTVPTMFNVCINPACKKNLSHWDDHLECRSCRQCSQLSPCEDICANWSPGKWKCLDRLDRDAS